jgi:hypothetical protein
MMPSLQMLHDSLRIQSAPPPLPLQEHEGGPRALRCVMPDVFVSRPAAAFREAPQLAMLAEDGEDVEEGEDWDVRHNSSGVLRAR